ncbi:MAG TPA: hypothetical protein VN278_04455 [Methanosarcina sp.]|nr:hypothetical protein [Methanosarcina sp.]
MNERNFSLSYLVPIAKELARVLEGKERDGFLSKIQAYYLDDPRSLSGMLIGNSRLLINEVLRLRKQITELQKENKALKQIDMFLLMKEIEKQSGKRC